MSRPADMPSAERWPHGVRARYVCGCRCEACRKANRDYAAERARARIYGRANGLVDAAPVRAHLQQLRLAGIGRDAVAAASDIGVTTISEVAAGTKTRLRKTTADRLLQVTVDAIADGALVPAGPTWKLIRSLLEQGFTKGALARRLGAQTPALQLRRHQILASTAQKVARFHKRFMEGHEAAPRGAGQAGGAPS